MADRDAMWEDNALQRLNPDHPVFYVDTECILCAVCGAVASANFRLSETGTHNVVYRQPATPEELDQCMDALDNCPVEAIGDDGAVP